MNGSGRGFPFPDREISTALDDEPGPLRTLHYLHSERLEGLLVEGAAASHVTYPQGQVVDEGKRHGQRHALYLSARSPMNIPELGQARSAFLVRETTRFVRSGPMSSLLRSTIIVPVLEASHAVDRWPEQTCNDKPSIGVPAHITLIFPFVPATQLDQEMVGSLEQIVRETAPFAY